MLLRELDFDYCEGDNSKLIGRQVEKKHYDTLIKESSYIYLEKHKPIVYLDLNNATFDELIPYLEQLDFLKSTRKTLGDRNKSLLFGAVTAKINHDNFCNVGATVLQSPRLSKLLKIKYSTIANELMKVYLGQWQKVGMSVFKNSGIHPDWQMADAFWTSGVINKNSPHNFHLDNDNSRNGYSAMITMKNNMSGGYLVFPEYRLAIEVTNRSMIFFCGKDIIHGVSPMNLKPSGYRYSIVYYTTADLRYCNSYEEEMQKAEI